MRAHVYTVERDNEVLRFVQASSTAQVADVSIKVGVVRDGEYNVLGSLDPTTQRILTDTPYRLTGQSDLNFKLLRGDICYVDSPAADGVNIEWKFARVGGLRDKPEVEQAIQRGDTFKHTAPYDPLFNLGDFVRDKNVRDSVEDLERQLNSSGVSEWVVRYTPPSIQGWYTNEQGDLIPLGPGQGVGGVEGHNPLFVAVGNRDGGLEGSVLAMPEPEGGVTLLGIDESGLAEATIDLEPTRPVNVIGSAVILDGAAGGEYLAEDANDPTDPSLKYTLMVGHAIGGITAAVRYRPIQKHKVVTHGYTVEDSYPNDLELTPIPQEILTAIIGEELISDAVVGIDIPFAELGRRSTQCHFVIKRNGVVVIDDFVTLNGNEQRVVASYPVEIMPAPVGTTYTVEVYQAESNPQSDGWVLGATRRPATLTVYGETVGTAAFATKFSDLYEGLAPQDVYDAIKQAIIDVQNTTPPAQWRDNISGAVAFMLTAMSRFIDEHYDVT